MDMGGPEHGGSSIQRLERIESAVADVKVDVAGLKGDVADLNKHVASLQQAEDRRYTDRLLPDRVRALEDQMLMVRTYLAQLKWLLAGVTLAVIGSVINITITLLVFGGSK